MATVVVSGAGTSGPRGNTLITGHGAPSNNIGIDGDYYMDNTNPGSLVIYGPKTAGVWPGGNAFGGGNLTAADGSVVVGGSVGAQTVRTGTLDVVAGLHPAAADWSNSGHKITTVGAGVAGSDVATVAQLPTTLPPNGAAGGDLVGSTYPNPVVAKIQGVALSGTPTNGQVPIASGSTAAAWSTLPAATTSTAGLVQLDGTAADIAPLGTQAAGAIGQAADAGHVHVMPRLDQINAPTASVSLGSHKIINQANGAAATDGAAFGQIPLVGAAGAGAGVALSSTDASVTNSRPPTGSAGGDLVGSTYPNPVVARVNGTAVPSAPAAGTALTATSSSTAAWTGTMSGSWIFNVAAYGAVGDGKLVTDGAMTATSTTLTSATASFTAGDVGKAVMVKGAASSTVSTLVTTITGFTNSTTVTLGAVAVTTVTSALVMWGTDDTAHIQAAVNAAITYATAHGSAKVFIPMGSGRFYAIAGALVTGGTTLGNGQITLGAPVATTANKTVLTIDGVTNGSALQHWQQTSPQLNGTTLVSFGVFASSAAQIANINANGNPCVIGGPAQPGGYGVAPGVFSNMQVTISNLSILTTYNINGWTYSAVDFSGIAEASLFDFAYGTTGAVPGGDFSSPNLLANGLSIGVLMPANGNNDNQVCRNVSCHGGYTFAFYATEHTVIDRLCLLYCWSGLCPVGTYFTSVGSTHGVTIAQLSIEACTIVVNFIGVGSNGSGPWLDIRQLDTEIANPTFADRTSGTGLNAALGTVTLTGLYNPASVTVQHPTGLKIINGQSAYPVKAVTANYQVLVTDQTILVDATAGAVTVTLISSAWTPNTYTVKKTDSSANAVTIAVVSGEHIDGATTQTLTTQWQKITVAPARVSSSWNWYAIG